MNRVVHFEIPVDDVERAQEFWKKTFGWTFSKWEGGETEYWMIETGPSDAMGINGGMLKKMDPSHPIANTIQVADIDAALASVEANGGTIVVPKFPVGDMGWVAYFKDLDGNIHGLGMFTMGG